MQTLINIKGIVDIIIKDKQGNIIKHITKNNVFTTVGKEWLAKHMSYSSYAPLTQARADCIRYIGIGLGVQPQVASVTNLVQPTSLDGTKFLAQLDLPTYPNPGEVKYTRIFTDLELSVNNTVIIQEAGLFTDGAPPNYTVGSRSLLQVDALQQQPCAYIVFDPISKTQDYSIEFSWTLIIG